MYPKAKGEVFFNALRLDALPRAKRPLGRTGIVVGMVARNAPPKDWPLFSRVAKIVSERRSDVAFWGVGADKDWAIRNCGADAEVVRWFGSRQDARELIAQMDMFLMTSKHEQLPTTLLEAFAIGVPVVGAMPEGGTREVTALSTNTSALLIDNRTPDAIAEKVIEVIDNSDLRNSMIAEGEMIVSRHFDMVKLCRNQLLMIYRRFSKEKEE